MNKTILGGSLQTIDWFNDEIVDWSSAGKSLSLTGNTRQLNKYHFGFNFDGSISSVDGVYAFIFQRLGTKGLLLKNGEIMREIDRSYYCADAYEYPATFLSFRNKTYLIHCPKSYCQLDFEDVETGELITNVKSRKPSDIFHSRLEVSPDNEFLMSKGWVWHPLDVIQLYRIADCFSDPLKLDTLDFRVPGVGVEICTASFINNRSALIGSSNEVVDDEKLSILPSKSFAVWDFINNVVIDIKTPSFEFGNLVAINERFAWDTYKYPKIIDLVTGDVVDKDEEVFSGEQKSSIHSGDQPLFAFNRPRNKLVITSGKNIVVLSHGEY